MLYVRVDDVLLDRFQSLAAQLLTWTEHAQFAAFAAFNGETSPSPSMVTLSISWKRIQPRCEALGGPPLMGDH